MTAEQGPTDPVAVPDELRARWQRAEERLALTALSAPELFQRSLALVARTVDHLRRLGPGSAPLLAASAGGGRLVTDALGDEPTGLTAADLDVVAQAALALRSREVLAERAAQRRVTTLDAGRARGETWVVLETSGDPAGDVLSPYRRLEAHVSTGRAVLVTTGPDADLTRCLHAVEPVLLDLASGALRELPDDRLAATTHRSAAERDQQAAVLRQLLSELP
jgi:hypothetical protein